MEHFGSPAPVNLSESEDDESESDDDAEMEDAEEEPEDKKSNLREEIIGPRKKIPPLLKKTTERIAENLDYIGVSYGLTQGLYNFWQKLGFVPLYMRMTPNNLTGEHTCIMANGVVSRNTENQWLKDFHADFRRRFVHLLAYEFRKLKPGLAMAILQSGKQETTKVKEWSLDRMKEQFSPYDLRRLESYSKNLVDYHVIVDMLPKLAEIYILEGFGNKVKLSAAQCAILMALGLQHKTVDDVQEVLDIAANQVLALLNKCVRKISTYLRKKEEKALASQVGKVKQTMEVEDE